MKRRDVKEMLANEVRLHRTPSVGYSFFDLNGPLFEAHIGMADVRNQSKATAESVYPVYSVTKTFTALGVLQLDALGLIDIDHTASRYLADFPYDRSITIRQLLNHSSGIPNPLPLNWIHLANDRESFDERLFFKKIFFQNKATTRPGARFRYSNLNYVLLGTLIEDISGTTYPQFITENIFKKMPVNECEIGFRISPGSSYVRGYQKRSSFTNLLLSMVMDKKKYMGEAEGVWKPFHDFYVNGSPYGGIRASLKAMVVYLQQLLSPDPWLLNNESKAKLFKENYLDGGRATGMCLSWFKGALKGVPYYTHAGGGGGFYCEVRIYPSMEKGSVIMFNRTGLRDERFLDKVDVQFL